MPGRNETVYLSGKCRWVRVDAPNQFGDYKFDLFPDADSLNKIMELKSRGLKNVLKNDPEGGPCMSFKRPTRKMMRNQVVNFGPPVIVDTEGAPTTRAVGNGSDVTVKLLIYEFNIPGGAKGIGARWDSLRVDNLVPFSNQQFTQAEEKATAGLAEQPIPNYNF